MLPSVHLQDCNTWSCGVVGFQCPHWTPLRVSPRYISACVFRAESGIMYCGSDLDSPSTCVTICDLLDCANSDRHADMKEHFVIDPLISKRQQLLLATQLCRMVLKVRYQSPRSCFISRGTVFITRGVSCTAGTTHGSTAAPWTQPPSPIPLRRAHSAGKRVCKSPSHRARRVLPLDHEPHGWGKRNHRTGVPIGSSHLPVPSLLASAPMSDLCIRASRLTLVCRSTM